MKNIYTYFAVIFFSFFFLFSVNNLLAQCGTFPYTSTKAGKINPSMGIKSNNPFCYRDCIKLQIQDSIQVDSICIDFGDNKYITVIKPPLDTTITYCYDFKPKDSCPANRPQNISIVARFYLGDPNATFSYSEINTSGSVIFLPHLPKIKVDDTVCVNDPVYVNISGPNCTNAFAGYPDTIIWNFFDGTTPDTIANTSNTFTSPNTSHSYSKPGIYYVKLSCTNACGTVKDSVKIVVERIDSVQFAKKACTGDTIVAKVFSSYGSYFDCYSLNGGATIIGQHSSSPKFVFNSAGTYIIAFTICNPTACTWYDTIVIGKGPTINFSSIPDFCFTGSNTFSFSNYFYNSSGQPQSNHFFILLKNKVIYSKIDSNIDATTVNLTKAGTYTVLDSSFNGCGFKIVNSTFNLSSLDSVYIPKSGCTGDTIKANIFATNTSNYSCSEATGSANIITSNTSSPKIIFSTAGTYTIHFTIGSGVCPTDCVITIKQGPVMNYTPAPDICFNGNDTFYFGNYFTSGVTSQSNNFYFFRNDTLLNKFIVNNIPSSVFLSHTGRYKVIDSSFNTCGTLIIKDSFDVLPPSIINLPNDFDTCLQSVISIPNKTGCTVYFDGNIFSPGSLYVDSVRIYSFIYIPGCGNADTLNINVYGKKVKADDKIYCFKPGKVALNSNHTGCTYSGNFVSNDSMNGDSAGPGVHEFYCSYFDSTTTCVYIDTAHISIYGSIAVSYIKPDTVCQKIAFNFINNNTTLTDTVDFGDTTTASGNSISHTYNYGSIKKYLTIKLYDNVGCNTIVFDSLYVVSLPENNFDFKDTVCGGDTVSPNNISLYDSSLTYIWSVDGVKFAGYNPPVIPCINSTTQIIPLHVSFLVSSSCSTVTKTKIIYILPGTKAIFGLIQHTNCRPINVDFIKFSDGVNLNYTWNINDSIFSIDSIPSRLILTAKGKDSLYIFTLKACAKGCQCDSISDSMMVLPVNFKPCFFASNYIVCPNIPVIFSDCMKSSIKINYKFGDGTFFQADSAMNVTHVFTAEGTYPVWLIATNNCFVDSFSDTIKVLQKPEKNVSVSDLNCSNASIDFLCKIIKGNPAAFFWYFGDSTFDILNQNPLHKYKNEGIYNGWMLLTDVSGCVSDTNYFSAKVKQTPSVNFTSGDTTICARSNFILSVDTTYSDVSYYWKLYRNNDSVFVTSYDGKLNLNTEDTGLYIVKLTATNNNPPFCSASSKNVYIYIHISPLAKFIFNTSSSFSIDFDVVNKDTIPAKIFLLNKSKDATSYLWNFDNGKFSNQTSPDEIYNTPREHKIQLIAYNGICSDTNENKFNITPFFSVYVPNAFTPNDDGLNDYFKIFTNGYEDYTFTIINRWGEKVYSGHKNDRGWDGTFNGKPCQEDVYVWIFSQAKYGNEINKKIMKYSTNGDKNDKDSNCTDCSKEAISGFIHLLR